MASLFLFIFMCVHGGHAHSIINSISAPNPPWRWLTDGLPRDSLPRTNENKITNEKKKKKQMAKKREKNRRKNVTTGEKLWAVISVESLMNFGSIPLDYFHNGAHSRTFRRALAAIPPCLADVHAATTLPYCHFLPRHSWPCIDTHLLWLLLLLLV